MEAINIPFFHNRILKFLLGWRKIHPEFTFSLRKSDLSKRLTSGYWFHGNDDYIAISFWTGMDWQGKVPNISFVIIPESGHCFLQFSAKDSIEKDDLFQILFKERFQLDEVNRAFYVAPFKEIKVGDYLKSLEEFLKGDKIAIDEIIRNNQKKFDTNQNPNNRIGFILEQDFKKNLSKTQKFQNHIYTNNLPIGLFEIEIKNYELIKELTINNIPTNAQWIFFTGENGTGKTTILRAIATALINNSSIISKKSSNYSIGITLQKNGIKSHKHRIKKSTYVGKRKLEILSKGLVCFGPVRLNVHEQMFSVAEKWKNKTLLEIFNRPHIQLFGSVSPLIDIGFVYNRKNEISKELKDNKEKLKFIMEAITSICDKIVDIHFSRGMRYFEVDRNQKLIGYKGTPFQSLASGYKSIIAMVSHMMLHLYMQQQEINDPALLEGIVIIDEIDLHFHPKMQRDLVIKLSEIFPRIQFIASTHSPIPLLGVQANTPIFTTKIDSEDGINIERMDNKVMFTEILPNALLTSPIFGLEEIVSKAHSGEKPLNTEDSYSEIIFNKKVREEIHEYITDIKENKFIKLFSSKK